MDGKGFVGRRAYDVGSETCCPLRWIYDAALEALSPTRCAGCERPGALICERCLVDLRLIDPAHSCLRCSAPHGDLVCTECMPVDASGDRPQASGAHGLWDAASGRCLAMAEFDGPLPRMIRTYKDAGERRLADLFGEMLADTAHHAEAVAPDRYGGLLSQADALVFVPATAAAFRRRGFDHMEAVARRLSELTGVRLIDALVKHGSADQRLMGRLGRRVRAQGAYEVVEEGIGGRRLVLVDDVITTGATLAAAAGALCDGGAKRVDILALARVCGG